MASPSFSVFFLASLGFLLSLVSCVSINAAKGLMRSDTAVQLQASGQVQAASSKAVEAPDNTTAAAVTTAVVSTDPWHDDPATEQDERDVRAETCNSDYPLGKDACSCKTAEHHFVISEGQCQHAAAKANLTNLPTGVFEVTSEFFHKRPKGCFKYPCTEDPKGMCYFFNGIGDIDPVKCVGGHMPDGSQPIVEGLPVCHRPKFLNGTADSTGNTCPPNYEVLMNEKECEKAAECLGYCPGADFRADVKNESRFNDFPEGCFIHKNEGCVYYNIPMESRGWPKPTDPHGTPICLVSTPNVFRAAE